MLKSSFMYSASLYIFSIKSVLLSNSLIYSIKGSYTKSLLALFVNANLIKSNMLSI